VKTTKYCYTNNHFLALDYGLIEFGSLETHFYGKTKKLDEAYLISGL